MKSFSYLFTVTLLLSTSPLLAMDPNDWDVQRRAFHQSLQRQREELQKSLEKQRQEVQQSLEKQRQEFQQSLERTRQGLEQAGAKYLQENDKAVQQVFEGFKQEPLKFEQFEPYKPFEVKPYPSFEAKPYEPLKFEPYKPMGVKPYAFNENPYKSSKPKESVKAFTYKQMITENALTETRILLENGLIFSEDPHEKRLLNDQLETVQSRLYVSRNLDLSNSDREVLSLQARQQLEEVKASMVHLQKTRAAAQQQKQQAPLQDLKKSVSVPSTKEEFPELTIDQYVNEICMGENPFDDIDWEMDTSTHLQFVAETQGKNLNNYIFTGTKTPEGILEYRLISKTDNTKVETPLKFKKRVISAPVSPQKAAKVQQEVRPFSPYQKPANNNFMGELQERLNSSKNQEEIGKAQAALSKLSQPKPVQPNDAPKPFAQLRPVQRKIPAPQNPADRPLPPPPVVARHPQANIQLPLPPVVQPAQAAPAKKWTVKMPPQLKK